MTSPGQKSFPSVPSNFANWTKSDTLTPAYPVVGFMVGISGNVSVQPAVNDNAPVVAMPCVGGVQYACALTKIMATGTDNVGTIVLFYGQ